LRHELINENILFYCIVCHSIRFIG